MKVEFAYNRDRESQLIGLNRVRNDPLKPRHARAAADKAYKKILSQMEDGTLVALRERLTAAARAGDRIAVAKITAQIKDHQHEDRETGNYEL